MRVETHNRTLQITKFFIVLWLLMVAAGLNAETSSDLASPQAEQTISPANKYQPEPQPEDHKPELVESESVDGQQIAMVSDGKDAEDDYRIHKRIDKNNPCDRGVDSYDYEKQWYDETQIYINTKFCEPALWFDNFFSNDRLFKEGVAGTYIRWRNDFSYDEEADFSFRTDISASVELPGFEDRLRLTFEGEQDDDLRDVVPGGSRSTDTTNTLGIQADIKKNDRYKFSGNVSLSPKLLLRYRYTYPVNNHITLRYTQELERKRAVNKARSRIDYEQTVLKNLLFRSSTEGRVAEDFDGVDWLQAFVLYQRLSKKSSLAYEASVIGITQPRELATNYRLGVRYRKNFHREWLFYEIAPEVTWPVTLSGNREEIVIDRRSKYLLFFRLEVHFGNASKKRYKNYY